MFPQKNVAGCLTNYYAMHTPYNVFLFQVFKGALFRTATEQKEQTRYFSKSVLILLPSLTFLPRCPIGYLWLSSLFLQEIHELFSLPEQGFDVSLTHNQLQEEHGQQVIM
jgi:DNA excision repair protein ERCC-6-like